MEHVAEEQVGEVGEGDDAAAEEERREPRAPKRADGLYPAVALAKGRALLLAKVSPKSFTSRRLPQAGHEHDEADGGQGQQDEGGPPSERLTDHAGHRPSDKADASAGDQEEA